MARATIILTAGHSDQKSGAVSPDGTIREANVCLMLRDEIARTLRGRGYTVVTDGPAGVNLSLNDAIKLARNHVGPELELHLNAGGGTGVEAYALPTQAKFAATIAQVVAQTLGLPLRGQAGWKDPSQSQHAKLGICNAGAVLLEVAFIDNREDMRRLFEYRQALADKLAGELGAWADGVYAQSVPAQHPPSIRPASAQRPPSVRATSGGSAGCTGRAHSKRCAALRSGIGASRGPACTAGTAAASRAA